MTKGEEGVKYLDFYSDFLNGPLVTSVPIILNLCIKLLPSLIVGVN